jgi:uncharacterized membrane protein YgaE (UPF0421/DUF939 family)
MAMAITGAIATAIAIAIAPARAVATTIASAITIASAVAIAGAIAAAIVDYVTSLRRQGGVFQGLCWAAFVKLYRARPRGRNALLGP